VKPRGDSVVTNRVAIDLSQHLPLACKIAGQKQSEEQTNRLDGLYGSQINLDVAVSRPAAKDDQEERQQKGGRQWQIAQTKERGFAKINPGHTTEHGKPGNNPLHVTHKQERVAYRILAAQQRGESDRRQQMGRR